MSLLLILELCVWPAYRLLADKYCIRRMLNLAPLCTQFCSRPCRVHTLIDVTGALAKDHLPVTVVVVVVMYLYSASRSASNALNRSAAVTCHVPLAWKSLWHMKQLCCARPCVRGARPFNVHAVRLNFKAVANTEVCAYIKHTSERHSITVHVSNCLCVCV